MLGTYVFGSIRLPEGSAHDCFPPRVGFLDLGMGHHPQTRFPLNRVVRRLSPPQVRMHLKEQAFRSVVPESEVEAQAI
jgi:hypothetical protein